MVTSQKMIEKEMGNRGSKSVLGNTVKEQRVYGSSIGTLLSSPMLRCTLMGFKSNYQVRIPSNQLNNLRSYSTANSRVANTQIGGYLLKPYFVTGFTLFFFLLLKLTTKHCKRKKNQQKEVL